MTINYGPTHSAAVFVALAFLSIGSSSPLPAQAAAASGGQTCVALVLPSATGVEGDATAFATSLRDLFASYLAGPSLRAINLEARLASQAIEEARRSECDYVLVTRIAMKHDNGSGWGRALGQAAGSAAYYGVPYYGAGAAAAAARGAIVAGAQAVSTLASTTRAKDELTLEFRLGTADTVLRASPTTEKAKARRDGEDLLTPLVEKAAEAIASRLQNGGKSRHECSGSRKQLVTPVVAARPTSSLSATTLSNLL